jgi:competence protein ComGC
MIELLTTYNIIVGISVVINIILLIGVRNLLKQNEQLEDKLVNTVNQTRNSVEDALTRMRELDNKEAFEKDDEVGVTFDALRKVVEGLNEEI